MLWAETIAISLISKLMNTVVIMLTGNAVNNILGLL